MPSLAAADTRSTGVSRHSAMATSHAMQQQACELIFLVEQLHARIM
ncbi:MAG: hypothetical protein H7316_14030 [Tardiphaga sp.]|nr:hypothetical protein [Tardiphaga sp.]MBC7584860.1 hypothetical protein [Tardiphaga sp.]